MNNYKNAIASKQIGQVLVVLFPEGKTLLKSNLNGKKLTAWNELYKDEIQDFVGRALKGLSPTFSDNIEAKVYNDLREEIKSIDSLEIAFGFKPLINAYSKELNNYQTRLLFHSLRRKIKQLEKELV